MKRFRTASVIALIVILTAACSKPVVTDAPVTSLSFSHSGMHTGLIYTLTAACTESGWQADMSLLAGEQEVTVQMTDADAEALMEIVRKHELNKWDGFDKADRRVQDGKGFELHISYDDGQTVYASGSNAFPKGYDAAHGDIKRFFVELMERSGFEDPF